MSREKQIEDMAKEIDSEYDCVIPCQSCAYYKYANCRDVKSAEKLYNAGYRKASDLAEEIFAEIEEELDHWGALVEQDNSDYGELVELVLEDIICVIAELKKKYIGKDTNVTTNTEEGK